MTYKDIEEIQKGISDLEDSLKAVRDESSLEAKKPINDALRLLQAVYDCTHNMDEAVTAKGC